MAVRSYLRRLFVLIFVGWLLSLAAEAADVKTLGPEGGDVRRLAFVPGNPDRVFLGTSSGRLFVSDDGGTTWSRFAHLGQGFDYVLDTISIDPRDTQTMYVAAWSIENSSGELFRSHDGGKSWTSLPGMRGKSIRSFAMAPSDSHILMAGTLEGVYRSDDQGDSWKLISPPNHPDIKNIQSVAVDPTNPDVVYAGTWHLAWKTSDGGGTWRQIKRGMIDDSDVFSIIVDPRMPAVVYTSACSGIYKSTTGGELFSKVQGIPFSARRTRVLKQDPSHPEIVYAGTTEGLWRTADAGAHWKRISAPSLIINDVMVDPRNSQRVLLATDRSGVMMTIDNGATFKASNNGFTHRQVMSVMVDHHNPEVLYAGVVNDKEFGGVFVSRDAGQHWSQQSTGLGGEDVFTLAQDKAGEVYAGTNRGLFHYSRKSSIWMRIYPATRSLAFQVNDADFDGANWILVGPAGIAHSSNGGQSWTVERNLGKQPFFAVHSAKDGVFAVASDNLMESNDNGRHWARVHYPLVSYITGMVVDAGGRVWIAAPQGTFYREADGNWQKASGLPEPALNLAFDATQQRLLAISVSNNVYATLDGDHWRRAEVGVPIRTVAPTQARLFAGTKFDGVVTLDLGDSATSLDRSGGGQR